MSLLSTRLNKQDGVQEQNNAVRWEEEEEDEEEEEEEVVQPCLSCHPRRSR